MSVFEPGAGLTRIKLDFEQRQRANALEEWLLYHIDEGACQMIWLRDELAKTQNELRTLRVEKDGTLQ